MESYQLTSLWKHYCRRRRAWSSEEYDTNGSGTVAEHLPAMLEDFSIRRGSPSSMRPREKTSSKEAFDEYTILSSARPALTAPSLIRSSSA